MAKAKTKGSDTIEATGEYLTAEQVAQALGITMQEHLAMSGSPKYPAAKYGPNHEFLGYSKVAVIEYRQQMSPAIAAQPEEPAPAPVPVAAPVDMADPEMDPYVEFRSILIPTTSEEISRCHGLVRGFSTQWTEDELLRLRKLMSGAVRAGETYIDYQAKPDKRHQPVRSTVNSVLKWLLRKAVPLTIEELKAIHMGQKATESEPGTDGVRDGCEGY